MFSHLKKRGGKFKKRKKKDGNFLIPNYLLSTCIFFGCISRITTEKFNILYLYSLKSKAKSVQQLPKSEASDRHTDRHRITLNSR